ncbi:hypothetical protein GQ55_4G256100 [Panicum hallii var. hallii]|uniref:Trithorax group protein osa-like n=1 Tax=Panicum hallii var. hallii TaxID=1504633 RepID=A0A2T7E035_9POAL|nr:hypothetical protein GQ55_4G256100 [Panicum hallii var. hallii]
MYPQMVYHADVRAREMELAADRQMGCSCAPLGRMISRMITKCNGNGRQGRVRYDEKMDYAMAYAPAQTCYVRPTARTVTLATTNNHHPPHAHAVQPEPPQAHATAMTLQPGTPFPSTGAPPQGARKPKKKKKKRVRFTPSGPVPADDDQPPPHHAQHHTATVASSGAGGTAGMVYHHGAAEPPSYPSPAPPPAHGGQGGHGYAYGYGRYSPSPLPRWETLAGTPRRHEYFSGEYRWYYPTPVREGIYSIATDANGRLSTIFSEENPNACTIV